LREQIRDSIGGIIGDDFQDPFQPGKGIYIVMFAGSEEGIEHSSTLCSGMGSGKQVIAPPQIMKSFT